MERTLRRLDVTRLAAAMRKAGVRSEPEFGFIEMAAAAVADAYHDLDDNPSDDLPPDWLPGAAWIRERMAEAHVEEQRRATEVRTDAARRLLDAGRIVHVERGLAKITVVDGDVLDFAKAIEQEALG